MVEGGLFVTLDNLSPAIALQTLAGAAQTLRAAGQDSSSLLDVRIGIDTLGSITTVELHTPVGDGRSHTPAAQQVTEAVLRAYSERVSNIVPTAREAFVADTLPLSEGVAQLLVQPVSQPVEPEPTECLVVIEGIDARRAGQIFEDARFDATSVRTLVALAAQDAGRTDRAVYLFHIRDDRGRRSTFQGALSGERFTDCTQLACFDAGGGAKVFLPAKLAPGRPELEAFRDLVRAIPTLGQTGGSARPPSPIVNGHRPDPDERLVAVYPRDAGRPWQSDAGTSHFAVVYLGSLQFRDQLDIQPQRRAGTYEVVDLRASETVAASLRDVIERSGTGIGYRLELRATEYTEPPEEQELSRLDQEIFDLELRRAALRSLAPQKPFLFRFSQGQLAGLADVLRAYPPRVLQEGQLQYAFQPAAGSRGSETVRGERTGLHFVLVDPEQAGAMMEKLRFPEFPPAGPTMRFWLDPYWARYYLDQGLGGRSNGAERTDGDDCLVFVPYGTALFPSMHDWDTGEMQEYLQFAVRRWFTPSDPGAGPGSPAAVFPERAVYIFDGRPDPNATIHVTVLDRDRFCPLKQQIGWINTNLEAMRPDTDVEDIISSIADARTREAVLSTITARAAAAEESFDRTVIAANAHVASRLKELIDALNVEMTGLIDRAQRTTTDVVRLKSRLQDLDITRLDMRRLDTEVTGAAQEAGKSADGLNAYYNAQLRSAQQAVKAADTARLTADKEIVEAVKRLQASRANLEKILDDLL